MGTFFTLSGEKDVFSSKFGLNYFSNLDKKIRRWLISLDEDSMVRLWPLHADQLLDLARRTAGRNLSPEEWDQYLPGLPYHKTFPEIPGSLAGQTSARKAKERALP